MRYLILCLAVTLAGCGGSSGGSQPAAAAITQITFPMPGAVVVDDFVTVRGTATSPDGVVGVTVNGLPATSSNGFATWERTLPVFPGVSQIVVGSTSGAGVVDDVSSMQEISSPGPVLWGGPPNVAAAPSGSRAYRVDPIFDEVVEIDLGTGLRRLVVGAGIGSGVAAVGLRVVAVDEPGGRIFVSTDAAAILEVDLATGARTLRYDGVTSGLGTIVIRSMAFDEANGRLLALTASVTTGTRILGFVDGMPAQTVSADFGTGSGPGLGASAMHLQVDAVNQRAYVTQVVGGGVFDVDLATGNRVLFFQDTDLLGTVFGTAWNPVTARLLAIARPSFLSPDPFERRIVSLDVAAPLGTVVASSTMGQGTSIEPVLGIAVALNGGVFLSSPDRVLALEPSTGDRTAVSETRRGPGPELRAISDVDRDPDTDALWLVDDDDVVRVDPATGARTRVSVFADLQQGPQVDLRALAFDSTRNRALVAGQAIGGGSVFGIYAVDSATGQRSLVTTELALPQGTTQTGAALRRRCLVYDAAGDRLIAFQTTGAVEILSLANGAFSSFAGPTSSATPHAAALGADGSFFVIDGPSLVRIDLTSGVRTTITPSPPIASPQALTVDAAAGRLLVLGLDVVGGIGAPVVTAVTIATGAATPFIADVLLTRFGGVGDVVRDGDGFPVLAIGSTLIVADSMTSDFTVLSR